MTKVHMIYNDYHTQAIQVILAAQPDKNLALLVKKFDKLWKKYNQQVGNYPSFDYLGTYDLSYEARDAIYQKWRREVFIPWEEKLTQLAGHTNKAEACVKWLKEKHGYVEYEFDDHIID